MDKSLLPDHCVVLVVAVVSIPQLAIRTKLELKKLVTELALVADIVTKIEIVAHLMSKTDTNKFTISRYKVT